MCLWEFLRVTIGTCVFCADGIMITNNSNNYHVFLNVFMFRIMSMTLRNINPQKEIFHHYDFPVYTTSKYRDPKLDTYRRITHSPGIPPPTQPQGFIPFMFKSNFLRVVGILTRAFYYIEVMKLSKTHFCSFSTPRYGTTSVLCRARSIKHKPPST